MRFLDKEEPNRDPRIRGTIDSHETAPPQSDFDVLQLERLEARLHSEPLGDRKVLEPTGVELTGPRPLKELGDTLR